MKKIGLVLISFLFLVSCKNNEMTASGEDGSYQREPTILALEIQVEKTNPAGDFDVLSIQTDTLEHAVSPLPNEDDFPELFKAEVLNASNEVVFGSEHKTRFNSYQGKEIANLKFFCSLTRDASTIKIYYQIAEGVWKQIEAIDL